MEYRFSRTPAYRSVIFVLAAIGLIFPPIVYADGYSTSPRLLWRFMTGGRNPFRTAVGHDGILYVASNDGNLYALYPDGTLKWSRNLNGRPATAPVIGYDGRIYIGTWSGAVYAMSPNGRLEWIFRTDSNRFTGNPALGVRGDIYLPGDHGMLYAVSYSGELVWSLQLQREIVSDPSIGRDGTIYIATDDRRLNAIHPDGAKRWDIPLSGIPGTAAIAEDGTLYIGALGIHAVSPEGTRLWDYLLSEEISDPVIGIDGTVFAGSRRGILYAIGREGKKLWDISLGSSISYASAITEDNTVIAASGEYLVAVSNEGAVLWKFRMTRDAGPPLVDESGTIYASGEDWVVYALDGGHGGIAASSWPVSGHDVYHSGRVAGRRDLYQPSYEIMKMELYSDSMELKSLALQEIEQYLLGKRYIGIRAEQLEQMLEYAVFDDVKYRSYRSSANPTGNFMLRIKSCQLLGELATEKAKLILLNVLLEEKDITIKCFAVEAIGKIGYDRDGTAARAFERSLTTGPENNQLALAIVSALRRISEHDDGFYEEAAFRTLIRIVGGGYIRTVRQDALNVITTALEALKEHKVRAVQLPNHGGETR